MPITLNEEMLLSELDFDEMVRDAAEELNNERPLWFDAAVPDQDAPDDEVLAEFTGAVFAADIITDDAEAVIHEGGALTVTTDTIPNFKHGRYLNQAMMERLARIRAGNAGLRDMDAFAMWLDQTARDLARGLQQRKNWVKSQMMRDSLTYSRYGVQITGSWGKPAAYKPAVIAAWDDHTNGKGVSDILAMKQYAEDTDGVVYDGLRCSRAAFNHLVQQAEFIARIAGTLEWAVPTNAFAPRDPRLENVALPILGLKEVTFEDATFKVREKDGTITTTRYQPLTEIILYRTADVGDPTVWDFANAITSESRQDAALGDGPEVFGPHGYRAPVNVSKNPPGISYWAVQRGWVRSKDKRATASINTGSYTS